jgi:predicted NBD/HSP70 family sugar kinase
MNTGTIRLPTSAEEVGTILKIIHLLGGKGSFADIADPQQHPETRHEAKYSADLIRRALDALTVDETGALVEGETDTQYLRLLDRLEAERGRGRPRIPYVLRYDALYSIAITAQRRFYVAYLADLTGAPVNNLVIEQAWKTGEPKRQELQDVVSEMISLYEALPQKEQCPLLAIAVTAPGPIDSGRGIIQSRQMGELSGYNLVDDLAEQFRLKVLLHEDSQAFALAEMYAGRRELSLIAITLGEGFGYAISHEGKLLEGAAGPWQSSSHFVLPNVEPALICEDCHRAGCIRAYLGQTGRKRIQAVHPEWSGKNSAAAQHLTKDLLAHVVAIQTITVDPLQVTLDIGSQYLLPSYGEAPIYDPATLIPRIRELATVPGRPIPTIEQSKLEPSPRARGAGILPLHHLFQHPDAGYWRQLNRTLRRQAPL